MKKELLLAANIDYENGMKRFAGNTVLYEKYLLKFREDKHFEGAIAAYDRQDYDTLLKETHTLKGVAGTLGLLHIYQKSSEIVSALRTGELEQIPELVKQLQKAYEETLVVLN